jgi:hypothetical protein
MIVTDENDAIARIRELIARERADHGLSADDVTALCRTIGALDDWLSTRNRLPLAWEHARRP